MMSGWGEEDIDDLKVDSKSGSRPMSAADHCQGSLFHCTSSVIVAGRNINVYMYGG